MTADQHALTRIVLDRMPDAAVVSNLGTASWILAGIEDRPRNYYMLGAMGSTTPTGFGLALSVPDEVVVLDGDGSMLMSLGALATVGLYDPENLTIVVFDNSTFATTGGQPTLAEVIDFAGVAEDCGLAGFAAGTEAAFEAALEDARSHDGASLIQADVEYADASAPPGYDFYPHSHLKHRFREAILGE